jgi:hypothetical protein
LIGCDQPIGHLKENVPFPLYCKMDKKEKEKENAKRLKRLHILKGLRSQLRFAPKKSIFFSSDFLLLHRLCICLQRFKIKIVYLPHRCTVVGNQGGVIGVLAKVFLGGYLGLSENVGGSLFHLFHFLLHFYVTIFRTLPPSPLCASMTYLDQIMSKDAIEH